MVEKSLSKDLQALTLKEDVNNQNLADTEETRPEVSEDNNKVEEKECKTLVLKYEMTKQELRLQKEEQKYSIYIRTFSYEEDNLDLASETDTESECYAYPIPRLKCSF